MYLVHSIVAFLGILFLCINIFVLIRQNVLNIKRKKFFMFLCLISVILSFLLIVLAGLGMFYTYQQLHSI
jgi:hypothetical protein